MKRIIFTVFAAFFTVAVAVLSVSCGTDKNYELGYEGNIFSHGEQTVILKFSQNEEKGKFKDTVSVEDITLSDGLVGKTVKSVSYIDASSVAVTLDGTVTEAIEEVMTVGTITVRENAFKGKGTGKCIVQIYKPQMTAYDSTYKEESNGRIMCSVVLSLPFGSFVKENINSENISLTDTNGRIMNMELSEDGTLFIRVYGYDASESRYPVVRLAPEVTTFNKEIFVLVGYDTQIMGNGYELM